MPVFNNALAGAAGSGGAGDFKIERSLRFNPDDGSHLSRTPSTAGNRKKFTVSVWAKRSSADTHDHLFQSGNSYFRFQSSGELIYYWDGSNSVYTNGVFRDFSAWYHIVLVVDTTQSTAANRIKFWVNGVEQATTSTSTQVGQDADLSINNTAVHYIGSETASTSVSTLDGYMADFHFLDGIAISDPDGVFGEFDADTGVWNPIEYTGSYNGAAGVNYSSQTITNENSGYTTDKMFDGVYGSSANLNNSVIANETNGTYSVYTFASPISYSSSVRIFADLDTRSTDPDVKANNTSITGVTDNTNLGGANKKWYTVLSGSGTLSTVSVNQHNGYVAAIFAIEVDGTVLVDSTAPAGVNGFHLDFSDNSSPSALGNDAAGSNNWTVNNIASPPAGNFDLSTASLNPWGGASYETGRGELSMAFDGDTESYLLLSNQNNHGVNFSPGISVSSKVEIYGKTSGQTVTTNLASGDVSYTPNQWTTVYTGSGTLTSVTMISNNNRPALSGIKVDGVEIIANGLDTDSLLDSPTNYQASSGNNGGNYCTLNPLTTTGGNSSTSNGVLSQGNLRLTNPASNTWSVETGTIGVTSGKWYYEYVCSGTITNFLGGWADPQEVNYADAVGNTARSYGYYSTGNARNSNNNTSLGSSYAAGDIIGCAIDVDNQKIYWSKNGSWQNNADPVAGTGSVYTIQDPVANKFVYTPAVSTYDASSSVDCNFGQRPFSYTPPTGFKSLCTQNLDDPLIADGSTAFDAVAYDGTGAAQSISLGFSPDLVWTKQRSGTEWHYLIDTVRGNTKALFSNATNADYTTNAQVLTAFNSDGYSLGSDSAVNGSSSTYVGWAWDAGSSTDTNNTAGSITPTGVRANQSAGFSIVNYVGTGANATVGHGLNAAPGLIIIKNRDTNFNDDDWRVWHSSLAANERLVLNATKVKGSGTTLWQNTLPTSSVFYLDSDQRYNNSGDNHIAYCFAPVAGYSAFGSYTGNGSSDGPFVHTGFRPALVICKPTTTTGSWQINDSARNTFNVVDEQIFANESVAATTTSNRNIDFLSNGFKVRGDNLSFNGSGHTYIYIAIAENPFKTARAR